ncbi:hypothetical protein GCM10010420_14920 [Streptomyces glaucosporus]|uniref:Uncharacterized protein n=1 Tax=Streptomyces glaucosporus TaxID=284044 RepID=A0ABN3I002_9ACTN
MSSLFPSPPPICWCVSSHPERRAGQDVPARPLPDVVIGLLHPPPSARADGSVDGTGTPLITSCAFTRSSGNSAWRSRLTPATRLGALPEATLAAIAAAGTAVASARGRRIW